MGLINGDGIHNHDQKIAGNLEEKREQQVNNLATTFSSMFGGH